VMPHVSCSHVSCSGVSCSHVVRAACKLQSCTKMQPIEVWFVAPDQVFVNYRNKGERTGAVQVI